MTRLALTTAWGPMPAGYWLVLATFAGLVFGFNLGGDSALTEHETVVAGVAKQMVRDGSWGFLWVGDYPWLEKPPLPHWLAAAAILILGDVGEAAVRLPSALAGTGVVLLVAALAARWFGQTVGLLSGLIQASTWYMLVYARLSENDMVLCLLVVGAIVAFVHLNEAETASGERLLRRRLIFWLLIGATNLAKGPLFGAAMALVPCLGWLAWRRDAVGLRRLLWPPGIVLALLMALAWPAAIAAQGHGHLLLEWWKMEIFGRLSGTLLRTNPPWYYLLKIPVQLLPWTPLLVFGAGPSLARALREPRSPDRFLWCWAVLPIALLSLSPNKHHHYIIHALPAFAPVMAFGLVRLGHLYLELRARGRRIAERALVTLGLVIAAVAVAVGTMVPEFRADAWVIGGLLATSVVATGVALHAGRRAAATAMMMTVLLAALVIRTPWFPHRDSSAADREFLLRVAGRVPAQARLFVSGGLPVARHLFYIQRPVEGVWFPRDLAARLEAAEPFFVVLRAREKAELAHLGLVTRIDQSSRTRHERSPLDRYTLYRVEPAPR